MADGQGWPARSARLLDGWAAWRAARARPATGFRTPPEPRTFGLVTRGRQLLAGNLMFAGHLVETPPGTRPWGIAPPDPAFTAELHGFGWLDDLAAVGTAPARSLAQDWLWDWIGRYGAGRGPGWTADLAGRRLTRWIEHALFLTMGRDAATQAAFFRALAVQAAFAARRWRAAPPGLERFEAVSGVVLAGLMLEGLEHRLDAGLAALERVCRDEIDAGGAIPTRNPEELMEVLTLLTWIVAVLRDAGRDPGPELAAAIARVAPTLRGLRHADGGLPRFHGGGRGVEGRLDQALAATDARRRPPAGLAMGYARLRAGRTTLIVDAARPPGGRGSFDAHASTLAFELTSGRRPVIVNCGAGGSFGAEWRRAGRATPSHSTLCLEGRSSARLGKPVIVAGMRREMLEAAPTDVPADLDRDAEAHRFEGAHDGYRPGWGVTHARMLALSLDGRGLSGEDLLLALEAHDKRRFDAALDAARLRGLPYQIRFHLHPEVDAELDMGGAAVSLAAPSGEIWVFRHDGAARLSLERGVYLERGRLRPRAAQQIVLSGRAFEYATRVRWSVAKTQETATAVRDLVHAMPEYEP
ncbi:heparinase II/III family protein [Rhodosalinus sp. K401]|uniref:heparinase II/III family protein n=1 Tax=Rhodosalinus sp. K401 TaxID=3239195 RepID=UPI00352461E1